MRTEPAGRCVFLTMRVDWYVMLSVLRVTALAVVPGREVGRGSDDADPGTPFAEPGPDASSVRCEFTMTVRAGSKIPASAKYIRLAACVR